MVDNGWGALAGIRDSLVLSEMDEAERNLISTAFEKRKLGERGVDLTEILSQLCANNIKGRFTAAQGIADQITGENANWTEKKLSAALHRFYNAAQREEFPDELVLGFILFSDYLLERTGALDALASETGQGISSLEQKLKEGDAAIKQLSQGFGNKAALAAYRLAEWLLKSIAPGKRDAVLQYLSGNHVVADYLSHRDAQSAQITDKAALEKRLKKLSETAKHMRIKIYQNAATMGRRYQSANLMDRERRREHEGVIAGLRFEYAQKFMDASPSSLNASYLLDAGVKYALGAAPRESLDILEGIRPFTDQVGKPNGAETFQTGLIAYASLYALRKYELEASIEFGSLRMAYERMQQAVQMLSQLNEQQARNYRGDVGMVLHSLKHSNERLAAFLFLAEGKIGFQFNHEPLRDTFSNLYGDFLKQADRLIRMGNIVGQWDRASYRRNVFKSN